MLRWTGLRKRSEFCVAASTPGCPAGRNPALEGKERRTGNNERKPCASSARLDSRGGCPYVNLSYFSTCEKSPVVAFTATRNLAVS